MTTAAAVVVDAPQPTNAKDLRSFPGFESITVEKASMVGMEAACCYVPSQK